MNRLALVLGVAFLVGGAVSPAAAIPIYGSSDPTNNSADFNFERVNVSTLRVSVENTSNYDSRVTGFGFDLYNGVALWLGSVTGTLDNSDWRFSFDAIPGSGDRDAFAITGANLWGGDPLDGIAVDMTGIFDFLGQFDQDVAVGNVLVRWQRTGADGEGSDRGYGCTTQCTPTRVPEPSTLALLGLGLLIGGSARRRRPRGA